MTWKPTDGKFQNLERVLNAGMHAGKPVYLHYTDEAGCAEIMRNCTISDARRNETREGSASGIYLCPSSHALNQENVLTLLFLGNERYRSRGTHVVVFAFQAGGHLIEQPVTHGSWAKELIYTGGNVAFTLGDLVYAGRNPFVDVFSVT